jgi:integrase
MENRKPYMLGLGGLRLDALGPGQANRLKRAKIELDQARARASRLTDLRRQGVNPALEKQQARQAARAQAAEAKVRAITFKTCAEQYIAAHRASWRSGKHATQWEATLKTFAYPVIGDLPVADIETGHITQVLQPLWTTKTETASRLRGRIELVLDYAKASGWRTGENPARWRGHLDHILPRPAKISKPQHHAALSYSELPSLMRRLRVQEGMAALALRFLILTAARTGEILGATWEEVDLDSKTWKVPPERMKAAREHRVPLSDDAVTVLRAVKATSDSDTFVFADAERRAAISEMKMPRLLKSIKAGTTVHGFRSTFRDWAAEQTNYPAEIAEAALAHVKGDKTVSAYLRTDHLDRRRELMQDWGDYCAGKMGRKDVPKDIEKVGAVEGVGAASKRRRQAAK